MAIEHESLPLAAVQFHPESVLTAVGEQMLGRFLALAEEFHPRRGGAGLPGADVCRGQHLRNPVEAEASGAKVRPARPASAAPGACYSGLGPKGPRR